MENLKKKYINKRYTDKDFEGLGHYISVSDVKDDDKLKKSALEQGESYYLADENGYLIPSNIVHNFLKNKELDRYFTEQSDANDRISQQIKLRAADRQANLLTPGVKTFVVAPLALTAAGIGGATLAPFLAPGTLGGNIIGTTAFGEALNHAIKYGTGKTMGEHAVNAAHYLGIPESKLGDFGIQMIGDMPIYVTGDIIGKQVANTGHTLTKEALDQLALDNRFKGIPINPTTKDLAKAMNKEIKNKQFDNPIPGQIGWAPRQTLTGYHASNEPIQEFKYWYPNWAVREHNTPHGIYFTANETRPSGGFLAKRPYIEQVSSTFDRPMVQVGEIPTSAKNATRNAIERQAQSMGADGIIYQGIKDNQLENQTIVKTLNPDQRVNVSEIIENDPYQITKILDNEKIRLRLPTHTKNLPREIVLEPQGNNQYRIHIRTWNGDHVPANLDSKEKQALFESVYNELPEGTEILFPESSADYPATRGTVAALTHLSRDPRFQRGNTTGTLIYADKDGNLQTFTGNSFIKGEKPLNSHLQGEAYLKDSFGKEITPTPFPGTDNELSQMAYDSQIDVLKNYFTNPQKIEQVKSEMHWGDKEYDEFQDELMRILGTQADVNIRDLQSGFTNIGSSSGKVIGEGTNAEARQKLSLNKDRIANVEQALETIIHEIGGHGKTLSIRQNPNDVVSTKFGKWFPRMKQFTRKNKTIANTTLELNEKGKLFSDFDSENALKHYLKWNNYSPSEINDLLEQYRHFKYATDEQELYARGYTSQLMQNLKPTYKTLNQEQLERYYTPESVKKYINSVLSISVPIIGSYGLIQSNRKGGKLISRKRYC